MIIILPLVAFWRCWGQLKADEIKVWYPLGGQRTVSLLPCILCGSFEYEVTASGRPDFSDLLTRTTLTKQSVTIGAYGNNVPLLGNPSLQRRLALWGTTRSTSSKCTLGTSVLRQMLDERKPTHFPIIYCDQDRPSSAAKLVRLRQRGWMHPDIDALVSED